MSSPAQPKPLSRGELARAWRDALGLTDALGPTAEVPLPDEGDEHCLRDQLERLIDAVGQPQFSPKPAEEVGATLVARGFTGAQRLGCTVELLGRGLPELAELRTIEELASKVASLLGALVCGYTTALHRQTLDQGEAWFREVLRSAPVGMAISRLDGTIAQANPALTEILHYSPVEFAVRELRELFHPDDAALLRAAYQALVDGKRERFQNKVKLLAANGDTAWVDLRVSTLPGALGSPTRHLTIVEDVTDRQLLEQRVRHQSLHDVLTGLPNRLNFVISLEALLERDRGAAVMVYKVDLDCFAVVNDGLGQGVGDLLLRSVATRLQALVTGEHAMVARFGADQFAIFIEESPSTPDAATVAARINATLSELVNLAGRRLAVSACVGVARRIAGETDAKELIRAASATLHQAQQTGRGQWRLYDPPADAKQRTRYALATAMPAAWENGQVTLTYQSLVRLDSTAPDAGQTVALAALLRWDHPERGVVAHEECLALAEQTGLILSIGRWMLRQACQQLRSWRDQVTAAVPPVRIDLTTYLTQDPDLVGVVRDALQATRLEPQDIQLGMPIESVVAGHGDTEDNVRTLTEIGVRIALTRYGQAVGNLVLLESLPVYGVELAASLVRTVAQQPESVVPAALTTLVPLIRRTGTAVVVAGIDDAEQAIWWRDCGADSARGAAFAPPVAPQDVPSQLL